MNSTLNIRIDKKLKENAGKTPQKYGLGYFFWSKDVFMPGG